MSILSFEFIGFVAGLVALFYLTPVKVRWVLLLLASMVFYAFSGWQGCIYLLCVAALTWSGAFVVAKLRAQEKKALAESDKATAFRAKKRRKAVLVWVLLLCLGALAFIKYFGAVRSGLNSLFAALQWRLQIPTLSLFVVLGLSYFTFQSLGYLIEVFRGKVPPERNPLKYLLYVSFFPQMTQGPVSPYQQLAPQLLSPKRFEPEAFVSGFQLAVWGYFKKLVLADRLVPVTTAITGSAGQPGWLILLCVVLSAIRLYADFSGGMDVIRGVALMLGVDMVENFRRPFFSLSIAEYWRRWHISLGAWFRAYLFYPMTTSRFGLTSSRLGQKALGKKVGRAVPGFVATLAIFLAIGIWHTANWNAVLFGAYFGLLLGTSLLLEPFFKGIKGKLSIKESTLPWRIFCLLRTWVLILLPQYFAFTSSPRQAFALLGGTVRNWSFANFAKLTAGLMAPLEWAIAGVTLLILLAVDILCECGMDVNGRLARGLFLTRWLVLLFLIVAVLVFGCYGEGFDGAAFLYTQF